MTRLENWFIEHVGKGDLGSFYRLCGNVYGHSKPWLLNGEHIYTSPLQSIDFVRMVAQTDNTLYTLGKESDGTVIPFANPEG